MKASAASQGMTRSAMARNRVGLARLAKAGMAVGVVPLLAKRNSPMIAHRSAVRSAAAAASGASTRLARDNAQSIRKGGQGEAGPMVAAETVATPKISTGT